MKVTTHSHYEITGEELAEKLGLKGKVSNLFISVKSDDVVIAFDCHE